MFPRCRIVIFYVPLVVGIVAMSLFPTRADAQGCCGGGGGGCGGHDHSAHGDSHEDCHEHYSGPAVPAAPSLAGPHGGQLLIAYDNTLEVVILPNELRVYLYAAGMKPLSAQVLQGQIVTQISSGGEKHPAPLQYVFQPHGSREQDFLGIPLDTNRLVEGQATIGLQFDRLPDRSHPKATFTLVFSRAMIRPLVALVPLAATDRDGIAGQHTCPVTGAPLGSMGQPVKLMVGNRPVYLCCEGCVTRVKEVESRRVAQPPNPPIMQ